VLRQNKNCFFQRVSTVISPCFLIWTPTELGRHVCVCRRLHERGLPARGLDWRHANLPPQKN
jgi:hypothetical protein